MVVQMYECHNVPLVRLRPAAQRGAPFRRKCRTPPVGFAPSRAQELSRSTPHDTSVHEDGHRTKHGDSQVLAMRMPARPADAKTDASLALRFPEGSFATLPQTARHGLARQQHVTPPHSRQCVKQSLDCGRKLKKRSITSVGLCCFAPYKQCFPKLRLSRTGFAGQACPFIAL